MDRTLQSTYSELLGLYPPNSHQKLHSEKLSEKALPPLKLRRRSAAVGLEGTLKQNLAKEAAFLDAYVAVPVYSYLSKTTPDDDIQPGGCLYSYSFNNDHWNKKETYEGIAE